MFGRKPITPRQCAVVGALYYYAVEVTAVNKPCMASALWAYAATIHRDAGRHGTKVLTCALVNKPSESMTVLAKRTLRDAGFDPERKMQIVIGEAMLKTIEYGWYAWEVPDWDLYTADGGEILRQQVKNLKGGGPIDPRPGMNTPVTHLREVTKW